jgi:hypothetical protein
MLAVCLLRGLWLNPKFCLLLTATIKPHATAGIYNVAQSERDRYIEYREALRFYLKFCSGYKIVFCENSSSVWFDVLVSEFADNENIEFIHSPPSDESIIAGKGFGEGMLIIDAISQSKTLAKYHFFIKITGRYKIYNIKRIISIVEESIAKDDFDFILRPYKEYPSSIQTFLFFSKVSFWREKLNFSYLGVNDFAGLAYESVIGRAILQCASEGSRIGWLTLPPLVKKTLAASGRESLSMVELYSGVLRTKLSSFFKEKNTIKTMSSDLFT